MQKRDLECFTGAFPAAETDSKGQVVSLTETSKTLELLFQFMRRAPPPSLEYVIFGDLLPLSEAAEKYEVYSALTISRTKLKSVFLANNHPNYELVCLIREFEQDHAKDVLAFAMKHLHYDLFSEVAPLLVGIGTHYDDVILDFVLKDKERDLFTNLAPLFIDTPLPKFVKACVKADNLKVLEAWVSMPQSLHMLSLTCRSFLEYILISMEQGPSWGSSALPP